MKAAPRVDQGRGELCLGHPVQGRPHPALIHQGPGAKRSPRGHAPAEKPPSCQCVNASPLRGADGDKNAEEV